MARREPQAVGRKLEVASKGLIGKSPRIVEVYKTLARAAMSTSTVLVIGESGTGKELVARAIHDNSPRRTKRFVAVNCGALAENLLESELFGHVKGSFTGAIADKQGPVRGGQRRDAFSRRDRRRHAQPSSQAPARPAGKRVQARRLERE